MADGKPGLDLDALGGDVGDFIKAANRRPGLEPRAPGAPEPKDKRRLVKTSITLPQNDIDTLEGLQKTSMRTHAEKPDVTHIVRAALEDFFKLPEAEQLQRALAFTREMKRNGRR